MKSWETLYFINRTLRGRKDNYGQSKMGEWSEGEAKGSVRMSSKGKRRHLRFPYALRTKE